MHYFDGEMVLQELPGTSTFISEVYYKKYKDKRSGLLRSLAAVSKKMKL